MFMVLMVSYTIFTENKEVKPVGSMVFGSGASSNFSFSSLAATADSGAFSDSKGE